MDVPAHSRTWCTSRSLLWLLIDGASAWRRKCAATADGRSSAIREAAACATAGAESSGKDRCAALWADDAVLFLKRSAWVERRGRACARARPQSRRSCTVATVRGATVNCCGALASDIRCVAAVAMRVMDHSRAACLLHVVLAVMMTLVLLLLHFGFFLRELVARLAVRVVHLVEPRIVWRERAATHRTCEVTMRAREVDKELRRIELKERVDCALAGDAAVDAPALCRHLGSV